MFKRFIQMVTVAVASSLMTVGMMSSTYVPKADYDMLLAKYEQELVIKPIQASIVEEDSIEEDFIVLDKPMTDISAEVITVSKPEVEYDISQEEIELIAQLVMAEAGGESEYGQRLVIDVILNRVDHPAKYIPDTITEVIYQPNQFSPMWNGRFERCYVKPEIVELVKEELVSRTNYDVIFFRTSHYSEYGTPMFQEGAHYFSSL